MKRDDHIVWCAMEEGKGDCWASMLQSSRLMCWEGGGKGNGGSGADGVHGVHRFTSRAHGNAEEAVMEAASVRDTW
jgi:hypothetical protein